MISRHIRRLSLAVIIASPLAARGNDIHPAHEYYVAPPAAQPVVLDGDISEWDTTSLVQDPQFAIPKGSGAAGQYVTFETLSGDWTGPEDQSNSVMVSYDADNVYVGVLVIDEYHENSANSAWNGDSLQMMVASSDRTAQVGLYNFALGGVEGAFGGVIVQTEAGPGGIDGVVARNGLLTFYEIKLPKSSLGLADLEPGVQFGLGMAINDGDQGTPGQGGWGGLGAHALVFGKSPSETALITLGEAVPEPSGIVLALFGMVAARSLVRRFE